MPSIPSAACHFHSTPPSSSHSATSTAQTFSSTPPAAHRWNHWCTVLLGPNFAGSSLHWQPVRIRKMTPLNVRRQWAGGRPVGLRGQNSLRIGSIRCHKASGTSQIVPSGLRCGLRRFTAVTPLVSGVAARSATTPYTQRAFRRFSDSY